MSGLRRVWTVGIDGSAKHQAFTPPREAAYTQDDCARWSPKRGAGLAYIRSGTDGPGGTGDGYLEVRLNTGSADRSTRCWFVWGQQGFDFSPDGGALILASTVSEADFQICNLDGSAGGQSAEFHGGSGPAWSPDGRYIAVGTEDGVHLIRVDGGGNAWLRVESQPIQSLSWQPLP